MVLMVFELQGGQNRVRHVQIHPWDASNASGIALNDVFPFVFAFCYVFCCPGVVLVVLGMVLEHVGAVAKPLLASAPKNHRSILKIGEQTKMQKNNKKTCVVFEVQGGQNRVRHVQIHPWDTLGWV